MLGVGSGKGGVGTTTVAVRLAVSLARMGHGVLLVDADPQRADAAAFCGLEPARSLADFLLGHSTIDEIIVSGPSGVGVAAGPSASALMADCPPQGCQRLIEQLRRLEFSPTWVVLDTGSGISQVARRFRLACDGLLMVTTPDPVAVMDTYAAMKHLTVDERPPEIACVVNAAGTVTVVVHSPALVLGSLEITQKPGPVGRRLGGTWLKSHLSAFLYWCARHLPFSCRRSSIATRRRSTSFWVRPIPS